MSVALVTPNEVEKEINKIETILKDGQVEQALQEYEKITSSLDTNDKKYYYIWVNYASALFAAKKFEETEKIARKSIEIFPSAEGYHNLGCSLREQRNYEEAIKFYRQAIHLNPELYGTHNDIAVCYETIQELERAIDHFQIATTLDPSKGSAWLNLARLRFKAERHREALSAARVARKVLGDDDHRVWDTIVHCISIPKDIDINHQLLEEVQECLERLPGNVDKTASVCHELLLQQNVVKSFLPLIQDYRVEDFASTMQDPAKFNWSVFDHPLFSNILWVVRLQNKELEAFFTTIRSYCLDFATQGQGAVQRQLWDTALGFLAALAAQCFVNEYIYFETEDEREKADALERRIEQAVEQGQAPDPFDLCILGCYTPLYKIVCASKLAEIKQDPALDRLLKLQLIDPLREQEIKKSIQTVTSIDDEVSQLVKEQYEENPYPRWVETFKETPVTFKHYMNMTYPFLSEEELEVISEDKPTRTLIAGCGTGQQSVNTSFVFDNTDILALDISASSLAYAIRKTEELEIDNIEYGLADILKMRELNEQFDVIHCNGVLHHMREPIEGWRVLCDIIKPGGFMTIGLYSDIARRHVVAAREIIRERGFAATPEGIRSCREMIKNLPADHPTHFLLHSNDFYSMSNCRDFIFHVQEHRFTTEMITECLERLGLRFLGFTFRDIAPIMKKYKEMFPDDPYALNLENWHQYELQNPRTFKGMYNFWVQKK